MAADLITLSWCLGDIRLALTHAEQLLLQQLQADPADFSALRAARAGLHQAHGALQIVDLDGVSLLTQEAEAVLDAADRGEIVLGAETVSWLGQAFRAVIEYIEALIQGETPQPLHLYPYYRALLEARRAERVHPSDLFFPDLDVAPDPAFAPGLTQPEALAGARSGFERGLLMSIRDPGSAVGPTMMRDSVAAVRGSAHGTASPAFWWVAHVFFEGLLGGRVPMDVNTKRFLARFNLQLRKTLEERAPVAERLLKEMLFTLAAVPPGDPQIDAVQRGFGLDGAIPADYETPRFGRVDAQAMRLARESLGKARTAFDKVSRGSTADVAVFTQSVDAFRDAAAQLPAQGLQTIGRALGEVRRSLTAESAYLPEPVALELATAILFAEQMLDQGARPAPEHDRHGAEMAARLSAALAGQAPEGEPPEWLRALGQAAQERLTIATFAAESMASLRQVEQGLDGYFRDVSQSAVLPECTRAMRQVAGALRLLGHESAARGAEIVGTQIEGFADIVDGAAPGVAARFEQVAGSIGALGFFIEGLQQPDRPGTDFELDEARGEFRALMGRLRRDVALPGAQPSAAPVVGEAPVVAEAAAVAELAAGAQPAAVVEPAALTEPAALAIEQAALAEPVAPVMAAPAREAEPASPVVAEVPVSATEPAADAFELDGELLDIFLTEAEEVLEAVAQHIPLSAASPRDQELLTTMRRGFHTLKGSGRMVGLNDFGEAAWAMEQVLNLWLGEDRAGEPPLYDLIAEAHRQMSQWVQALRSGQGARIDPQALIKAAQALRDGQAPPMLEPIEPAEFKDDLLIGEPAAEPAVLEAMPEDAFATAQRHVEPISLEAQQDTVTIGEQTISRPLYLIFLSEADELIRVLEEDTAAWRDTSDRDASETALRAAHSLAGSASVVQLQAVHALSEALERVYLAQQASQHRPLPDDFEVLSQALSAIHGMLHQFAAGAWPPANEAALVALQTLEAQWAQPAFQAVPEQVTPAVTEPVTEVFAKPLFEQPALLPTEPSPLALPTVPAPETAAHADQPIDEIDPELLGIFIEEASDDLPRIGETLRTWVDAPADARLPQNLMRLLHTVKGSARMAGAMQLGELLHDIETEVEALVALPLIEPRQIEALITDFDRAVTLFESIAQTGVMTPPTAPAPEVAPVVVPAERAPEAFEAPALAGEPAPELTPAPAPELVGRELTTPELTPELAAPALPTPEPAPALAPAEPAPATPVAAPAPPAAIAPPESTPAHAPAAAAPPTEPARAAEPAVPAHTLVRVRADLLDKLVNEAGEVSIARSRLDNELATVRQSLAELSENVGRLRTQLRELEIQADTQILQQRSAQQRDLDRSFDPLEFDRYTRFQELTRMMAESVNDVATVQGNAARSLDEATQDLHRQGQVLRDLQQNLMRVRMVQFSSIADRLYRVVRQAARETDKRVHLDIRGANVEVDRSVLERMAGPIEHLLRNAVAHGIESVAEREAQGKPDTGELQVEVRQEGREIVLSFVDDGGGLDLARIRARALAHGLIDQDATLSDRELADLIFVAGFSTAASVTELSGRGVGLDVVRAEVASLGGRIETESRLGRGTRFTVHLPLTLAVAQVVLVVAGRSRFAVPSSSIEQVMQLKPQALAAAYAERVVHWQGQRVPLFFLGSLVEAADPTPVPQHYSPVVIIRSGHQLVALHTDEITRNQEVVVKNVGPQVARVRGITGATVLGNGEIVLIINPVALAQAAAGEGFDRVVRAPQIRAVLPDALPPVVMVVDDSITVRKVTQRLLTREGYKVLLAKDGIDALRQLEDVVPDAMLLDIEMPRMDGFDLTRNLRANPRFAAMPILMSTSRTADKHRNHALSLGVNVFLGKPYQEDELLAHLARFTESRHSAAVAGLSA